MHGVRRAGLDEVPRLGAFLLEAWSATGPGALGWTGATDEAMREIASESFLRNVLSDPERIVFLAEEARAIVGFAVARMLDESTVELAGIIVVRHRVGQGIGSTLVRELKAFALDSGFARIVVKTEALNERARAFYERHGFRFLERRTEDVRGTPVDLAVLRMDL